MHSFCSRTRLAPWLKALSNNGCLACLTAYTLRARRSSHPRYFFYFKPSLFLFPPKPETPLRSMRELFGYTLLHTDGFASCWVQSEQTLERFNMKHFRPLVSVCSVANRNRLSCCLREMESAELFFAMGSSWRLCNSVSMSLRTVSMLHTCPLNFTSWVIKHAESLWIEDRFYFKVVGRKNNKRIVFIQSCHHRLYLVTKYYIRWAYYFTN